MNIINIRDTWPSTDVVQGTITMPNGDVIQTLQHDPCPAGSYLLEPHVIQSGSLADLATYALVSPALGVFHEPADADGYTGPFPVRLAILFHPGNWPKDSLGCILPGKTRDTLPPTPSVGQSEMAFSALMNALGMNQNGHTWTIQDRLQ